jgi:hypothetical protein
VVGIQNTGKDKGLTVAYQQAYLKNILAVRVVEKSQWLQVSPSTGSLGFRGGPAESEANIFRDIQTAIRRLSFRLAGESPSDKR